MAILFIFALVIYDYEHFLERKSKIESISPGNIHIPLYIFIRICSLGSMKVILLHKIVYGTYVRFFTTQCTVHQIHLYFVQYRESGILFKHFSVELFLGLIVFQEINELIIDHVWSDIVNSNLTKFINKIDKSKFSIIFCYLGNISQNYYSGTQPYHGENIKHEQKIKHCQLFLPSRHI